MSPHLNSQQTRDWIGAVTAVQEVAANTDTESGSKPYMSTMANFVRDEPQIVVHLLTKV